MQILQAKCILILRAPEHESINLAYRTMLCRPPAISGTLRARARLRALVCGAEWISDLGLAAPALVVTHKAGRAEACALVYLG